MQAAAEQGRGAQLETRSGYALWEQPLETTLKLSASPVADHTLCGDGELPDVFVYLLRGEKIVSYQRFPAATLLCGGGGGGGNAAGLGWSQARPAHHSTAQLACYGAAQHAMVLKSRSAYHSTAQHSLLWRAITHHDMLWFSYHVLHTIAQHSLLWRAITHHDMLWFSWQAHWVPLLAEKSVKALDERTFPGSLLLRIGLFPRSIVPPPWSFATQPPHSMRRASLHVHLYTGRNLPASDANGALDPYVELSFRGVRFRSTTKNCTRNPRWFEAFVFEFASLPDDLGCAPELTLRLFDYDTVGSDDYVGMMRLSLEHATQRQVSSREHTPGATARPRPSWHELAYQNLGDGEGQLLLALSLEFDDREPSVSEAERPKLGLAKPPLLKPVTQQRDVELTVFGCRSLTLPSTLPGLGAKVHLEFDVGGAGERNGLKLCTPASRKPSVHDPNFLQNFTLPLELPDDQLFAPTIDVTVVYRGVASFGVSTVLGTSCIPLRGRYGLTGGAREGDKARREKVRRERCATCPFVDPADDDAEDDVPDNTYWSHCALLRPPAPPEPGPEPEPQQGLQRSLGSKLGSSLSAASGSLISAAQAGGLKGVSTLGNVGMAGARPAPKPASRSRAVITLNAGGQSQVTLSLR